MDVGVKDQLFLPMEIDGEGIVNLVDGKGNTSHFWSVQRYPL